MEEELNVCEVCFEAFDRVGRLPKIQPCCKRTFCLQCLEGIFKKNDSKNICPTCRGANSTLPSHLPTNEEIFQQKIKCPNCKVQTSEEKLVIDVTSGSSNIECGACSTNTFGHPLQDYLLKLKEEWNYYLNSCGFVNKEVFDEYLEIKLNDYVNTLVDSLKKGLKIKLKQKLLDLFDSKLKFKTNSLAAEEGKMDEFKTHFFELYKVTKIKDDNITKIKSNIDFYATTIDEIQKFHESFKNVIDHLNDTKFLHFDQEIVPLEELENFIKNLTVVSLKNRNHLHEYESNLGISWMDKKLLELKQSNDELKKQAEVGRINTKKLEENTHKLKKAEEKLNEKVKFVVKKKNLSMQNFTFSYNPPNDDGMFNINNFDKAEYDLFNLIS